MFILRVIQKIFYCSVFKPAVIYASLLVICYSNFFEAECNWIKRVKKEEEKKKTSSQ